MTTDTKFLQIPEIHSTHSYGKEPTENILGGRRLKKKKKKIIGRLQILSMSISSLPPDQVGNNKRLVLVQGLMLTYVTTPWYF